MVKAHFARLQGVLAVFVCLLVLASCAGRQETASQAETEQAAASQQLDSRPQEVHVALVLPLSGPYAAIANKIRTGADAAKELLRSRGITVNLAEMDSNDAGWTHTLKQLPPEYTIVGGPLRPNAFHEASLGSLEQERVFFTFLQGLSGATEGRDAWRFFSSPDDQIRTLLQTARNEFNIRNIAVLYPQEPFGKRISKLFSQVADTQGVTIPAMEAYPPEDPLRWSDVVAQLLFEGAAGPELQAVFLPDVWSKVEMLVPLFFYHQREDLLLMGSTLWGQTLSETPEVEMHNFRLALFPAAYWDGSNATAARELRNMLPAGSESSLWEALGFDFIRFASRLAPIPPRWDAALVNSRIQQAQGMDWSMAPIAWSQVGEARQDMFLFTPTEQGMRPADLQAMRQRRESVLSRKRQ